MGAVEDIIMSGAGGIGHGVSQGIQDYANIQKIKEEEQIAPLRRGIIQTQHDEAVRKEAEAKKEMLPFDITTLPGFKDFDSETQTKLTDLHKTLGGRKGDIPKVLDFMRTSNEFVDENAKWTIRQANKSFLDNESKIDELTAKGASPEELKPYTDKRAVLLQKTQGIEQQVVQKRNSQIIKNMVDNAPTKEMRDALKMFTYSSPAEAEKFMLEAYKDEKAFYKAVQVAMLNNKGKVDAASIGAAGRITAAKIGAKTKEDKAKRVQYVDEKGKPLSYDEETHIATYPDGTKYDGPVTIMGKKANTKAPTKRPNIGQPQGTGKTITLKSGKVVTVEDEE